MSPSRAGVRTVGSGAGDDEPEADPADVMDPERTAGMPRPLVVVLAVAAILGLFGTVFFFNRWRHLDNRNRAAGEVSKASSVFLNALTNFNANTIDADFQHIQDMATGDFHDQALKFFNSDVRQALAKVQATSRGQIRYLYVESIQGDSATTFGEVDQTIANLNFSRPEQDVLRVALTLKHLAQGWKISEVTVLQGPASVVPSAGAPTTTTPAK
ncbi:MAG: hypothetical protein ACYDH6_09705 [Acidimicrobiales bacterium]